MNGRVVPRTLRHRQVQLLVLCVGVLMIVLDGTVVNVALPSIQKSLGFSQSGLAWVVNAYLVPFGGLLLLGGRLGDLVGRKRMFVSGLVAFTVASLVCAAAERQEVLIAGRALQGVGGALASGVVLGMIVTMYPNPREQVKAIGLYGFVAAAGGSLGLLVGGVLTELLSWHWIFLANLPIGIATLVLAHRWLDEGRDDSGERADVVGAVLVTVPLLLLVYAILQTTEHGWDSPRTLVLGAVTAALVVGFVAHERRTAHPLVPLSIFRARNVAGANFVQVLMVAGLTGVFFLGALYLQRVRGFTVLEVGLAFLPLALAIATTSLKGAPRALRRWDARTVVTIGLGLTAAGLAVFATVPVHGSYPLRVLPALLLLGTGAGLGIPAILTMALTEATSKNAGLLSGIVNTTQQVGGALGLAVLATVSTTRSEHLFEGGTLPAAALTDGYRLAFAIAAALVVVGIAFSAGVLKLATPRTAPRQLDGTRLEVPDHADVADVRDPDFLALGLGGTSMMSMLWSVAMGRRAVGVEMRGDPAFGLMHWSLHEDLYHHFAEIDRLMLERYGESRLPRRGDGALFRISECFFGHQTLAGDATADEVITAFDKEAHLGGTVTHSEFIDDRWRDGVPQREVTVLPPPLMPAVPDPRRVGRPLSDVLDERLIFQSEATDLLILLRRYLEGIERLDLEQGFEPRVRLFTHHRVVDPTGRRILGRRRHDDGFSDVGDGRQRIRIEAVRTVANGDKIRRVRVPGSKPIDIGVPELFMVAQGLDSRDASRLGFTQQDVVVDTGDGRGPVVAQADYLAGLLEVLVDGRVRQRIASTFDRTGAEHWVRQVVVGHEEDAEVAWMLVEVPEYKTLDPIAAGLVPPRTRRSSASYFAAHHLLLRDYFLEQAAELLEIPERELRKVQLAYGPKLFRLVERIGPDARIAANGVVAGDSFGNGHYLSSAGVMTGMLGHASRVLVYWGSRDAGISAEQAIRMLADEIRTDTRAWIDASAQDFRQPRPAPAGAHAEALAAARRERASLVIRDHGDEWTRFLIHAGHLYAFTLPPIPTTHPAARSADARSARVTVWGGVEVSNNSPT